MLSQCFLRAFDNALFSVTSPIAMGLLCSFFAGLRAPAKRCKSAGNDRVKQ